MTSRTFDLLISAWTFCDVEDREAFVAYLRVCGYRIEEQPETADEQPEAHGSSPCIGAREAHRPATYGQLVTAGETAPISHPQPSSSQAADRPAPNSSPVSATLPNRSPEAAMADATADEAGTSFVSATFPNPLERGADQASAISDTADKSSVGARQAVPHSMCDSVMKDRAPISDPYDPGPIPAFMDRRRKSA